MTLPSLMHETEVQRQHPRFKLPVKVVIDGKRATAVDWSVAGVGVVIDKESLPQPLRPGARLNTMLVFSFDGFRLSCSLVGQVCYYDRDAGRVGLRFVEVTGTQNSLLRYVVDAHLSGELVQVADLLNIAGRPELAAPRKSDAVETPSPWPRRLLRHGKQGLYYGAMTLIAVALVSSIASSIYDRMFVVPATAAHISADVEVVAAPTAGQFAGYVKDEKRVEQGELMAGIKQMSGNAMTVEAPCDCEIVAQVASPGAFVNKGQPLFVLAPAAARPYVVAHLAPGAALALARNAPVEIRFADGSAAMAAKVREIRRHPSLWTGLVRGGDPGAPVEVLIDLQQDVPIAAIGEPVAVSFDTFGQSAFGRLTQSAFGSESRR